MGVNTFQYGDDQEVAVKLQSTFGTAVVPAATNMVRSLAATFGQPVDYQPVRDRRKTRSLMEEKRARTPVQPWSISIIVRPSGTLGVAPDWGDLLKLVFGTEAVVASTSVTYSLLQDMTGIYATLFRELSTIQEGVYDAVCQSCEISWSGDGFAMITFSGVASEFIEASRSPALGNGYAVADVVVDDADFFTKFGVLQNVTGSDDNTGAGYQITAVDYDTNTLTLASAPTSWADNDIWGAFLPAGSYVGDPIFGTQCTFSLDGGSTTMGHLGGTISISTGHDLYNREAGTQQANDVILPTQRAITGTINYVVKEAETYVESHARRGVAKDFQIILGDTAAERVTFNLDNVRMEPGQRTTPEEGPVENTISFTARGTSGEDEINAVFD